MTPVPASDCSTRCGWMVDSTWQVMMLAPASTKDCTFCERVVDHQVAVLDEAVRDGLDDWWADCELGAEHAVHDVDVHDAGAGSARGPQLVAEPQQVRRQHADADRGPTVQQLPDGGHHCSARASSRASSL